MASSSTHVPHSNRNGSCACSVVTGFRDMAVVSAAWVKRGWNSDGMESRVRCKSSCFMSWVFNEKVFGFILFGLFVIGDRYPSTR